MPAQGVVEAGGPAFPGAEDEEVGSHELPRGLLKAREPDSPALRREASAYGLTQPWKQPKATPVHAPMSAHLVIERTAAAARHREPRPLGEDADEVAPWLAPIEPEVDQVALRGLGERAKGVRIEPVAIHGEVVDRAR